MTTCRLIQMNRATGGVDPTKVAITYEDPDNKGPDAIITSFSGPFAKSVRHINEDHPGITAGGVAALLNTIIVKDGDEDFVDLDDGDEVPRQGGPGSPSPTCSW